MKKNKIQGKTGEIKKTVMRDIKKDVENYAQDFAESAILDYLSATALVLHDKFDFKKEDLENFFDKLLTQIEYFREDYINYDDIVKTLDEEIGLNIKEELTKRVRLRDK
ncbi:hypothetical protein JXA27_06790 [Aerococcaceae bacterium zg-B36]|uniref:hypothetical protein n=1 Tax=Aerococcaceae bacterium zg-252 TaxID=2796928 RepID=UPI001BD902F1|nr:hypothetical protein [Aerococcaceae bacterium zg-B36]